MAKIPSNRLAWEVTHFIARLSVLFYGPGSDLTSWFTPKKEVGNQALCAQLPYAGPPFTQLLLSFFRGKRGLWCAPSKLKEVFRKDSSARWGFWACLISFPVPVSLCRFPASFFVVEFLISFCVCVQQVARLAGMQLKRHVLQASSPGSSWPASPLCLATLK